MRRQAGRACIGLQQRTRLVQAECREWCLLLSDETTGKVKIVICRIQRVRAACLFLQAVVQHCLGRELDAIHVFDAVKGYNGVYHPHGPNPQGEIGDLHVAQIDRRQMIKSIAMLTHEPAEIHWRHRNCAPDDRDEKYFRRPATSRTNAGEFARATGSHSLDMRRKGSCAFGRLRKVGSYRVYRPEVTAQHDQCQIGDKLFCTIIRYTVAPVGRRRLGKGCVPHRSSPHQAREPGPRAQNTVPCVLAWLIIDAAKD